MARFLVMILAGLVISTAGYFTLHFVDVRASNPVPSPAANAPESMLSELPAPARGPSPPIRVCLTTNPVSSLDVQVDGPYTLYAIGVDKPLETAKSLQESRVICQGQNIRIGTREHHATRLEIVPQDSPAIWVNGHQYRGRVRIYRQPGGKLLAVNVLPLEEYIASVVDSEMPTAFPAAARQAQAICSRTYAVYQMAQSRSHPYFDVYSSTRSQNYLGYQYLSHGRRLAGETAEGRQITQQTAGLVCTYQGEVFCTYYSAVCGGRTTPGEIVFSDAAPPLQSVPCDYCKEAGLYRWTEKHTKLSATQNLASLLGTSRNLLTSINRADNKPLTPASLFEARTSQKSVMLSAVELRRRLSLPSSTFQVWQDSSGDFLLQGRGHGHGVGLCQWGARGQALQGKSAAEILRYYYPGSQVVPMPRSPIASKAGHGTWPRSW